MKENRNGVYALGGVIVIALAALIFTMTRGSETSSVQQVQAEANAQVPKGLTQPSEAQVQQGLHVMGGGKRSAPSSGGIVR